ncbi:MAG: aspartyl protease family protein [Chitinophagales bacterium]
MWWLLYPSLTLAANFPLPNLSYQEQYTLSKPEGDFEVLVVPIKRAENLLLVEATVDSVTGNFIVDTGAPYLVLNKTYFRKGKSKDGASAGGVTGGMNTAVTKTVINRLTIQELYYKSLQADMVSLGHIEDSKGVKILGLLGASLFSDLEMEIDVSRNVLYLYKLNKSGDRIATTGTTTSVQQRLQIPFVIENNIIFINTSIGGNKLRYCLDTGAEINVLGNEAPKKVLQHFKLSSRNSLTGTSNQRVEVFGGELDELTIGDHAFLNTQTILTGLAGLQMVYNTNIDGILGYNFLAEGRVIINFRKKQLTMYFYNIKQQ